MKGNSEVNCRSVYMLSKRVQYQMISYPVGISVDSSTRPNVR
jgi:hypothetical protein